MIHFSPLTLEHIEWARQLHNDPEVLSMLTDPHVVSEEEQRTWFSRLEKSKSSKRLLIMKRDFPPENYNPYPIGLVRLDSIDSYNKSICIGMDIHKDYRGQGFAKIAYSKLISELFNNQNFNRIWLMVAEYNQRAIHVYTSLGFRVEGLQREALFKNECYYNYILMSILRSEFNALQK